MKRALRFLQLVSPLCLAIAVGCPSSPGYAERIEYFLASRRAERKELPVSDVLRTPKNAVPVWREEAPSVSVSPEDVLEAVATETAVLIGGEIETRTGVELRLADAQKRQIQRVAERQRDGSLLVVVAGRAVDLEPLAIYQNGWISGGFFASPSEANAVYEKLGVALTTKSVVAAKTQYLREYQAAAFWLAKCRPEEYSPLKEQGIERLIGPPEAAALPDCEREPPRFPPLPPGREETCVEHAYRGETEDGQRIGVWSVFNPYDEEIRMDFYEEGELTGSVWLGACSDTTANR